MGDKHCEFYQNFLFWKNMELFIKKWKILFIKIYLTNFEKGYLIALSEVHWKNMSSKRIQ